MRSSNYKEDKLEPIILKNRFEDKNLQELSSRFQEELRRNDRLIGQVHHLEETKRFQQHVIAILASILLMIVGTIVIVRFVK